MVPRMPFPAKRRLVRIGLALDEQVVAKAFDQLGHPRHVVVSPRRVLRISGPRRAANHRPNLVDLLNGPVRACIDG